MSIKTNFTQEDFIKILTENDLGGFTAFEPIAKGTVQSKFTL